MLRFLIALSGFFLFFILNVAFLVLHCYFLGEHTAAVCLAAQRGCILSNSRACSRLLPAWAGLFAFWINELLLYPPGPVCSAGAERAANASVLLQAPLCLQSCSSLKELLSNAAGSECIHNVLTVLTHNYFFFKYIEEAKLETSEWFDYWYLRALKRN